MDLFQDLAKQGAMIRALTSDSRRATAGAAFFAYPGEAADGRAYIADALARGASAVVWEEEGFAWRPEWRAPNVPVRGLKQRAGLLASAFHGHPSEKLWMCGVTGTNGKTSCSTWIAAALGGAVVGTLGYGRRDALEPLGNTTPDALELQRILKSFRDAKLEAVAMEVSSHGLDQGRVGGIAFDCALFTNLTQDHLDYHGSMEAYERTKARLFDTPALETAVLNLDDAAGQRLARKIAGRVRTIGYGFADAAPVPVDQYLPAGTLRTVETGQVGRFNTANALGVLGCLLAYGLPLDEARRRLANLPAVPGRMQVVNEARAGQPLVVVDYAHTPDALEKVLQALRPAASERGGRLVAVFGAGGDRDPKKRPLMGAVAAKLADRVFVTSDNPRGEDPRAIIAQIEAGIAGAHEVEPDRASAIRLAIAGAAAQDVVVVAGKGHEDYQEIAGRRLPFSDAAVARAALQGRSPA